MAIPVQTTVIINQFQAAGCVNELGRVVKCCSEECCIEGSTQTSVCDKYLVRYETTNCNECAIHETWFCEWELTPIPAPAAPRNKP